MNISIVITSYKREKKIQKIISTLINQIPNKGKFEIIISGNNNKKISKGIQKIYKKNIKLIFIKNKINSNALKRNVGIKLAKNNNIILLDDDCLPQKNFLNQYIGLFKNLDSKNILCGSVIYNNNDIEKNNFLKYRQSRHFIIQKNDLNFNKNLNPSQIVTMNMGFKNSKLLKKVNFFDKRFGNYGFEDFEFGFRLVNSGFKLIPTHPKVLHMDDRNFSDYLSKIYYLSRKSVPILKKININAWKNTIFFKVENNFIINFLLKIKIINILINLLQKIIILIEKVPYLYAPKLYRVAIFLSYCSGYCDRKLKSSKNYKWYR